MGILTRLLYALRNVSVNLEATLFSSKLGLVALIAELVLYLEFGALSANVFAVVNPMVATGSDYTAALVPTTRE